MTTPRSRFSASKPQPFDAAAKKPRQPALPVLRVGIPDAPQEREADSAANLALSGTGHAADAGTSMPGHAPQSAPPIVRNTLRRSGQPLEPDTRAFFESSFGRDFSSVRVHAGPDAAASARAIGARAYTAGSDVVFAKGKYSPASTEGRDLLAHELAHVAQGNCIVRRRVEMRDVGKGEQSGFAKVPQLIARLNAVANGLVFRLDQDNNLSYVENPYGTMTEFERRMKAFIDSGTPIRLRITNKSGLLPGRTSRFTETVNLDDFESGYVDIDDLLAADDLALQTQLVHFLTER